MALKLVLAVLATALLTTLLIWAGTVAFVSAGWGFSESGVILGAAVATYAGAFALPTAIVLALYVYFGRRKQWPLSLWPLLGLGVGAGFIFPRLFGVVAHSLGRLTVWALPTAVLVVLIFWLIVRPGRMPANPDTRAS